MKKRTQNGDFLNRTLGAIVATGLTMMSLGIARDGNSDVMDVKPVPKNEQLDRVAVNKLRDITTDGAQYLGNNVTHFGNFLYDQFEKSLGVEYPTEAEIDAGIERRLQMIYPERVEEVPLEELDALPEIKSVPYDTHVEKALDHVEEIKKTYQIPEVTNYTPSESDEITLARIIYAEVRSEASNNLDVLYHKGSTVLNRLADDSKKTIDEIIFAPHQYEAVSKGNPNRPYFFNPSEYTEKNKDEKEAWEACYKVACDLMENGPKYNTKYALHRQNGELSPDKTVNWIKDGLRNKELENLGIEKTKFGSYFLYTDAK